MRKPLTDWSIVLEQFAASGLSQTAFSREKGISPRNLAYWLKKQRKNGASSASVATPRFIELELGSSTPAPQNAHEELVVELPLGVVMHFRRVAR